MINDTNFSLRGSLHCYILTFFLRPLDHRGVNSLLSIRCPIMTYLEIYAMPSDLSSFSLSIIFHNDDVKNGMYD